MGTGMANHNTLSVPSAKTPAATQSNEVKVNENVTGVTQTLPEVKLDVEVPTIAATEEPSTNPTESSKNALETMPWKPRNWSSRYPTSKPRR